ncbi:MAG TPA: hypothetical protein VGE26_05660 [Sphingobacteriaceae bacterium]
MNKVNFEIRDNCPASALPEILHLFDEANQRMHSFMTERALSYQRDEMKATIVPVADFIIARVGLDMAGFIAMVDNHIIGIYPSENFRWCNVGRKLLNIVKRRHQRLNVNVFFKNTSMLELYLAEGFHILDYQTNISYSELSVSLHWNTTNDRCEKLNAFSSVAY